MISVRYRLQVLLAHPVCCLHTRLMMPATGACLVTSAFVILQLMLSYYVHHSVSRVLDGRHSPHESASRWFFSSRVFVVGHCLAHKNFFHNFQFFFVKMKQKMRKKNKKTRIRKKKFNFFSLFLMNLLLVKKFSAYFAIFFDIELHNTSIEHKT